MKNEVSRRPRVWLDHWAAAALAVVLLFVLIERLRMLSTPLERDEGEYACAAQLILHGAAPYTLCYNMKLPGTYLAYAAIMGLFGQTDVAIHLGVLLVNLTGVFLLYHLARRFLTVTGAAVAAATHALLTLSPSVYGFAGHATQFVIVGALGGLLALCRAIENGRKTWFFWSGCLFGLAFLMKQPGIMFGLFALTLLAIRAVRDKSSAARRIHCAGIALFLLGILAPLALVVLWIWRAGALERFWFWTFTYASSYGAHIPARQAVDHVLEYLVKNSDRWFWLAGGAAIVTVFVVKKPGRWAALGLFVFSAAAVTAGWRFSGHYFIQLTPALALFLGAALENWSQARLATLRPLAPAGFAALCLTVPFRHPVVLLHSTPEEAVARRYFGNPFVECREIGRRLGAQSAPSDTIAVLGSEPEILFYARRQPATAYIYMYDLTALHPRAVEMQKEMIAQIEQAHPKFLVFVRDDHSWVGMPGEPRASDAELKKWTASFAASNYAPAGLVLAGPSPQYFWGPDAFNRPPPPEPFITVLERKK